MIEIYTRKESCVWCIRAKEKLNAAQYDYKEIVVGDSISRDDFVSRFWPLVPNPRPTVPQIVINGKWIGGYEDLQRWLSNEKTELQFKI